MAEDERVYIYKIFHDLHDYTWTLNFDLVPDLNLPLWYFEEFLAASSKRYVTFSAARGRYTFCLSGSLFICEFVMQSQHSWPSARCRQNQCISKLLAPAIGTASHDAVELLHKVDQVHAGRCIYQVWILMPKEQHRLYKQLEAIGQSKRQYALLTADQSD